MFKIKFCAVIILIIYVNLKYVIKSVFAIDQFKKYPIKIYFTYFIEYKLNKFIMWSSKWFKKKNFKKS